MKRFGIAIGVSLIAVLGATEAVAQTGAARGVVLDEKGEPVEGATIVIEYLEGLPITLEVTTNKKGQFTQVGLRPGNYKFTASKEGYRGGFIESRVNLGSPTRLPDMQIQSLQGMQDEAQAAQEGEAQKAAELFNSAIALAQGGQLDGAEAALKEVLTLRENFPEAHYNLGYVHAQRKQWDLAEADYKKALELRPDYSAAAMALAAVYQTTGRRAEAEQLISDTAAAGGEDPNVYFNMGVVHLNAGRTAEAAEAFKKAEELNPDNPEIQYHLATIALQNGNTDETLERLEKYLSMSPKNEQNIATAQGLLQALKK